MVDQISLSEGRKRSFEYCQGPCIGIDIDFHQLWGKNGGTNVLIEWFYAICV